MKKIVFIALMILSYNISVSQTDTLKQTEEYLTIRAKFDYQTGMITNYVSTNFNPQFEMGENAYKMKDYISDAKKGKKFTYLTEMLDYMNKYGYTLVSTNTIDYKGTANDDKSSFVNTNQYLMIIIMKRPFKEKDNK